MTTMFQAVWDCEQFLQQHQSLLLEAFGDHVQVTCDAATMKMAVESYDHD